MAFRHASRAIIRSESRPIGHNAMVVLAVMATWAGPGDAEPVCFKEQESIARRAKLSMSSVRRALVELEQAGAIKRLGIVGGHALKKGTIKWGLILMWGDDPLSVTQTDKGTTPVTVTDKEAVTVTDKEAVRVTDNSSQESESDYGAVQTTTDRAAPPVTPPGAGTPTGAPMPENGPAAVSVIVGEVMAARGGSAEQAEKWIERKIAASTRPVRNDLAFIRACLAGEAAPAPKPAAPKRAAKTPNRAAAKTPNRAAAKTAAAGPVQVRITATWSDGSLAERVAPARDVVRTTRDGRTGWIKCGDLRPGDAIQWHPDRPEVVTVVSIR